MPPEPPPGSFKSDGCTWFPDQIGDVNLLKFCVEHDYAYWMGGTKKERLEADMLLRKRLEGEGLYLVAFIMFNGVRVGGGRYWPWSPMPKQKSWGYQFPKKDFGWGYGERAEPALA